jgi:hypothetical protein
MHRQLVGCSHADEGQYPTPPPTCIAQRGARACECDCGVKMPWLCGGVSSAEASDSGVVSRRLSGE